MKALQNMNLTKLFAGGLSIAVTLLVLCFFPKWTVDDAFISFRYASNLAHHGVLTWNVGADPVEGYTGVAWPVILAGAMALGIPPVTISHILGVVFFFLCLLCLGKISKQLGFLSIAQMAGIVVFATLPFIYTHVFSGLETMLFLFAAFLSTSLFISCLESSSWQKTSQFLAALLLLSLTRPEGVICAGLFLLALGYHQYLTGRKGLARLAVSSLLIYAVPAAAYFAWRYSFYGKLLPNTFYVKTAANFHLNYVKDLTHWVLTFFAPILVAGAVLVLPDPDYIVAEIKNAERKNFRAFLLSFCVLGTFCLFETLFFTRALLKMNYSYRFFIPFLPFLLLLATFLFHWGSKIYERGTELRKKTSLVVVGILGFLYLLNAGFRLKDEVVFTTQYKALLDSQHILVGQYLRETVPHGEWLGVFFDAGAIPYYSDLPTIDMYGLNDPNISKKNMSTAQLVDYFFAHQPGAAVLTSEDPTTPPTNTLIATVLTDPRFVANFRLAKTFPLSPLVENNYYELTYVRNDLLPKTTIPLKKP